MYKSFERGIGQKRKERKKERGGVRSLPGRVSRSLKREQRAWYSHVLLGFTSGGGVQHTLSLIPERQTERAAAAGVRVENSTV